MENSKGFEVVINGKKISRAGINKENYVITCILSSVHRNDGSEETNLYVGGLDSETNQNLVWIQENLKVGDSVLLKVINDAFDAPVNISEKISTEEDLQHKIRYYHQLKEELKDYLSE